jgi:adenosylhomocysteine nucleosidase
MSSRVAIIAAMPGELKPLVRGWPHEKHNGVDLWRWRFDEGEWVAACAGAGQQAATRAFSEIEKDGAIDRVISVGWAGALSESFVHGKAYGVSGVIDMRTGERFAAEVAGEPADKSPRSQNRDLGHPARLRNLWLVTSPRVADAEEKRRLADAYDAGLVDMEAAAVARLAAMRRIPFHCIKGVSDGFVDHLPDFNRFLSPAGEFRLAPFILFALLRPIYWPSLIRMGENSKQASQSIAECLFDFLDERAYIRKRNGYPDFKR